MKSSVLIRLVTVIVASHLLLFAEDVTVTVRGESDLNKEEAARNALHKAVEEAVGTYITSEQKVSNFELINDRILKHVEGYVKKYEELSSGETGGLHWVEAKALISQGKIVPDLMELKILFLALGNPRVMVLTDGKQDRDDYSSLVSDALNDEFLKKGFLCVDSGIVNLAKHKDSVRLALSGDSAAAASLGAQENADVVIIAKVYREDMEEIYGAKPCRISISGKAVWTDSGDIISSAKGEGVDSFGRGTEAVSKATLTLSGKLIGKIVEKWNEEVVNTALIQILITGLDYDGFLGFEEEIRKEIPEIHQIYERSYEDSGKVARIDVDSELSTQTLALSLTRLNGFKVIIKSRQAKKITCEVNRK